MKTKIPSESALRSEYEAFYERRVSISKDLEAYLEELLSCEESHFTIKVRVKSFDSFYRKYLRYMRSKNTDKIHIPDEIGARIVCPFLEDIQTVENIINANFSVLEVEKKGEDYSFKEFGYESYHILVKIPAAIGEKYKMTGDIAEIQVRTYLQEAWAEVEHELVYKAEFTPFGATMKRKLAAINASLSLADTIFDEFRTHQRQLDSQLNERRTAFYSHVDNKVDSLINIEADSIVNIDANAAASEKRRKAKTDSIDDLLLNALYAHNKGAFADAEAYYSRILELGPEKKIKSVIYKHRGMAYFAQSHYEDAANDFKMSLETEASSAAFYLLGVVRSCLQDYEEALSNYSRSLGINPHQKWCFFRRAQCYYHIGDYPESLSDCEAALRLKTDFEPAMKLRSILINKLKM
jgi:putative GTP pyrophosphokinase